MIALTEAAEFGDVGDFISQYGEHGVRRTLGRVLDGPVLPADEDPNSNDPRNRLFEFVIASKLLASRSSASPWGPPGCVVRGPRQDVLHRMQAAADRARRERTNH